MSNEMCKVKKFSDWEKKNVAREATMSPSADTMDESGESMAEVVGELLMNYHPLCLWAFPRAEVQLSE